MNENLTTPEIDQLIAEKVMGYRWLVSWGQGGPARFLVAPDAFMFYTKYFMPWWKEEQPDLRIRVDTPFGNPPTNATKFSTDYGAAMAVLVKVRGENDAVRVSIDSLANGGWRVHLEPRNEVGTYTAEEETLPLAICRAVLYRL